MKRTLKKQLAILLSMATVVCFCFVGCSSNDTKNTNNTNNKDSAANTQTPAQSPNAGTGTGNSANPSTSPEANKNGGAITGAKAGTYKASAKGYASDVKVTVTVDDNGIVKKIDVDASGETENIGQTAAPQIADKVVETQSLAVDSISGATYTSAAVIAAITDALQQAGVDSTAVTQ